MELAAAGLLWCDPCSCGCCLSVFVCARCLDVEAPPRLVQFSFHFEHS